MSAVFIYVSAGDQEEAFHLGQILVEERLAACANILGPTTALYWWEGKVEKSTEVALVLKTSAELVEAITLKINTIHTYDCPCVVALPITGGDTEFLNWIEKQQRTNLSNLMR